MAKIHAGHRVWASKKNRVQAPSRSATRTQTATSSSAPSATPNVNAPSAAAVVAAGVMSLASARSARRSVKKSVVSLRARGGEEDTRVCIPLEEILGFEQEIATLVFQLSTSLSHINPNPNLTPTPIKPTFSTGLQLLQSQELRNTDVEKVGGKSASLGEMISQLSDVGVPVPGRVT